MATTTNFGWETPDDTDLVKDGAAAIRTALGGVDTSFVDLKGGTTGQVLSKATNTDLDFSWTTPSSPAFVGCRLYKSGNQSISNATLTTITWSSESIDTNGFHDTGSNTDRITIPTGKGGKYLVTYRLTWNGATSGYRYQTINKNAGATILSRVDAPTSFSSSNAASVTMTDIFDLAAGDYIFIQGFQNSGGAIDILSDGGFVAGTSIFAAQYLGA